MESGRIVAWRYQYLTRLRTLRDAGCKVIFLDETWFDTHDVVKKGWDDLSCSCSLKAPASRGKRIMVLHAGGSDGWVPNSLFLSAKNIGDAKADYHDEMNAAVFENWFSNVLMKNIPRDRKCVIVLDNASYHSRKTFRLPTMATKKEDMVQFMNVHNLDVPNPLPVKSVLLSKIKSANIKTTYVVDDIAEGLGHEVLRLPPYHCILNPIEMIWSVVKSKVRKNNLTPSLSASVCAALRQSVDNVSAEVWNRCVNHTIKTEGEYIRRDLQNDSEQFVINLQESEEEED